MPATPLTPADFLPSASHVLSGVLKGQRRDRHILTDRAFAVLLVIQLCVALGLAVWVAPQTGKGSAPLGQNQAWVAAGLGGLFTLPPLWLIALLPGRAVTRHAVAAGQMLMSALLIYLTGGRIETHFHIFGSLAFLAVYRDWAVLLTATAVTAADHVVRGLLAPETIFGAADPAPLARIAEHVGWILFADLFLVVTMLWSERATRAAAEEGLRELGQYRLAHRLAAGGMGEVYLAEHRMLKRTCAVKVIRPEWMGDDRALTRFEREVRVTARLRHPNTVQIFDYGVGPDGTFYYVMEHLTGMNMGELVGRTGRLPAGRAVRLLRQVCGALREAHGMGLVHRDVNPSNILVCEMGGMRDVVKLVDFGLVSSAAPQPQDPRVTQQGTFVGTPEFASPEQARGAVVDARSDLYSLGAVAYLLLTGRAPFRGETRMDVLLAHCHEPPVPPSRLVPDVPPDLEGVVLRCLAKDPADRFPDADALDQALARCGRARRSDAGPDADDFEIGPGPDAVDAPDPLRTTMVVAPRPGPG